MKQKNKEESLGQKLNTTQGQAWQKYFFILFPTFLAILGIVFSLLRHR